MYKAEDMDIFLSTVFIDFCEIEYLHRLLFFF